MTRHMMRGITVPLDVFTADDIPYVDRRTLIALSLGSPLFEQAEAELEARTHRHAMATGLDRWKPSDADRARDNAYLKALARAEGGDD